MFPKGKRKPLPSTHNMDNLKVSATNLASTARVLSQLLSKLNKEKKTNNLTQATLNADRLFDASRRLVKQLDKYKAVASIPKRDFDSKLENMFRDVFSFLDGTENYMDKAEDLLNSQEKRMIFLAKQEAKEVLQGARTIHNYIKSSGL